MNHSSWFAQNSFTVAKNFNIATRAYIHNHIDQEDGGIPEHAEDGSHPTELPTTSQDELAATSNNAEGQEMFPFY